MRINRHIAILLLICFSVYLGHNLVPHHHHSESMVSPISSHCPIQHADHHACDEDQHAQGGEHHDKEHHGEDHPTHCHAFNDVVFEKHTTQLVKPITGVKMLTTSSLADLLSDLQATCEIYLSEGGKIPIKIIELRGSWTLRGPPYLV